MVRITDKYLDLNADTVRVTEHASCTRFLERVMGAAFTLEGNSFFRSYIERLILDHLFDLGLVKVHEAKMQRALACVNSNGSVEAIAFIKEDTPGQFALTTIIPAPSDDMDVVEAYLINDKGYRPL